MFFHEILEGQPDAVFGLTGAFKSDPRAEKVDLLVGVYKDENLKAELLPSVRKAKEKVISLDLSAEYLPIDGDLGLVETIGPILFGEKLWKENHGRIYGAQTVGGTGALRVGGEFLCQEVTKTASIPMPTWPTHRMILERAGCTVETYPYYSREKKGFDFAAMCKSLESLSPKTAVMLHLCCHNPTGCDPTREEWKEISKIMKRKNLLPFFDAAYQGLGDGLEKDGEVIRSFLQEGHEMVIAYSCSKNFSLYSARVGCLFIVDENAAVKLRVGSQVKRIIRALYSNPPSYGALTVIQVVKDEHLRKMWQKELEEMRQRLFQIRELLVQKLVSKAKKIDFRYLNKHKGMFSFVDLDKSQVQKLIDRYAIYLLDNGRISMSGLNKKNIDYVVDSLIAVCES